MSRENGTVRGSTLLVSSGSSAERWDLVIVGDGFRAAELALYASEVDQVVAQIFSTPPFDVLRNARIYMQRFQSRSRSCNSRWIH